MAIIATINPKEKGMNPIDLDPYIIDVLMPDLVGHDHMPSAFLVYLYLWRITREQRALISLARIAEDTGISKRSVQSAIIRLERRKLVTIQRESPNAIAEFSVHQPWIHPKKLETQMS